MTSRMGFVPYIMPGFGLAKKAADVYEAQPDVEGLILYKHGIFTFGASAREAYERMIEMVSLAEDAARRAGATRCSCRAACPNASPPYRDIAPILRGACSLEDRVDRGRLAAPHPRFPHRRRRSSISSTAPR